MKTKNETKETFSNIITPPDFVRTRGYDITIIDPEWTEIEDVAFFLKTSNEVFNVYVYRTDMNNMPWLEKAVAKSIAVVVNTLNTECSAFKDKVAVNSKSHYYGEKNFLMNKNRIEKPIDFFVQFTTTNQKEDNVTPA